MPEGEVSGQYKVKSHFTMPQEHYQSSDRKTVTKLTFPAGSRSADKIGSPMQGSTTATFKKPEGDSSIYGVENTSTCARPPLATPRARIARRMLAPR